MSTKIYDAYKYSGNIELLLSELVEMRSFYRKKRIYKILGAMTTILDVKPLVDYTYTYEKDDLVYDLPITNIMDVIKKFIDRKSWHPLNIEASAVVYLNRGNIYVQFFGLERDEFLPLNDKFSDFHYQNQSDKDENITEEEWQERKQVWDEIFSSSCVPSVVGLIYDFGNDLFDFCKKLKETLNGKVAQLDN